MQRNLFAVLAVCSVVSIALAVRSKVASYRELSAVNLHLVVLQSTIVWEQQQIRETQAQILQIQREITKRRAQ
jgi:hypothetical protein